MSSVPTSQPTQFRPFLKRDADRNVLQNSYGDLAFQGDYSGSNLIYVGLARPGTATSAAQWQIKKLTYSGSNLVSVTWPEGTNGAASSEFIFQWSGRAGYTFS